MSAPKSPRSSTDTTILNASTPPSNSELPATSRPISPLLTKSLWVQLSVASKLMLIDRNVRCSYVDCPQIATGE
jgi:hypothetical protein